METEEEVGKEHPRVGSSKWKRAVKSHQWLPSGHQVVVHQV